MSKAKKLCQKLKNYVKGLKIMSKAKKLCQKLKNYVKG